MRRLLIAVAAVLAVLGPGSPAWAHAQLVSADPAKGATLTAAPATVTLGFSERLNPDFTTIVVSDAARQRVAASEATVDKARGTITLTGALGNGVYTVAYRVVSVDGHIVQGSYPFTLADPNLPAAAPPEPSRAAAPAPADTSGGAPTWLLIGSGGGLLLMVAAAGLRLTTRRRARRVS